MYVLSPDMPIIVVDDNAADLSIIDYVLRDSHLGNEVLFFEDGASVLKHLDAVASAQHPMPALILLDINMPRTSGFEVLATLRANPAFGDRPIIAMLTSSDAEEDRHRAEELGANCYLAKQSGLAEFVALIDENFEN